MRNTASAQLVGLNVALQAKDARQITALIWVIEAAGDREPVV